MRLEVIAPSGEVIFDSDFKRSNLIDWSVADKQGGRFPDGSYLCVVTVKDSSGQFTRKHAIATLRDHSLGLKEANNSLLTAAQVQAADPASVEDLNMTIIGAGEPPATAVLAHDGITAHLVSGSGGLSISSGDFFANKLLEHIRLTAEGNVGIGVANPQAKLDVAGQIKASQGIIFPDGTVQYSASSKTLGAKSSRSSQKRRQPGSGDDFEAESITQNHIVKFNDNAGTLGDSIILESSGKIGIGTPTPDSLLNVQGIIPSLLGHLSVVRTTGSNNGFGLLMDATGTGNNNLGLSVAGIPKASFAWDNTRNFFGMANFVFSSNDFSLRLNSDGSLTYNDGSTSAERFRVTAAGKVGIGTTSPAASLDVVGNINSSTQFNIGGNRVLIAGSSNTFVGQSTSFVNTGDSNSFFGKSAGQSNSAGSANTFIGQNAGLDNNMGNNNTFVGMAAGTRNIAENGNTFIGSSAGLSTGDTDPNHLANLNTFVGNLAGHFNQTGANNSFFGNDAGFGNTGGNDNTFIGWNAGFDVGNASGSNNTLLGASSILGSASITNATAIGSRAVVNQSNSVVLGSITGVNGATADVKVGIGTTTPVRHLHVKGPGDQEIAIESSDAGGLQWTLRSSRGASPFNGEFHIIDSTAGASRFSIIDSGNVGIGITAPLDRLHVNGIIRVATLGSADTTTTLCRNSSNQIANCNSSSLRYKTNIQPFMGGLEIVKRLQPITFTWKQGGARDIGFGAEDVAKVEPLFTFTNDKGQIEGVKYDRIGVVLVNAVREQQTQIEQQQTLIQQQRKEATQQDARLVQQQAEIDTLKRQQKQAKQQDARLVQQQAEIDTLNRLVCAIHPRAIICKRHQLSGKP